MVEVGVAEGGIEEARVGELLAGEIQAGQFAGVEDDPAEIVVLVARRGVKLGGAEGRKIRPPHFGPGEIRAGDGKFPVACSAPDGSVLVAWKRASALDIRETSRLCREDSQSLTAPGVA